ncbi:hypothetical protein [uncultured Aquitalea sp.]|uniref:hypothetical protein n=1 Tax=uncultured Aquitalea sp. TaxID=540272 RepID=UPI0025DA2776|nr:hypothetical protein [uncultured Aquitalea sp.]
MAEGHWQTMEELPGLKTRFSPNGDRHWQDTTQQTTPATALRVETADGARAGEAETLK